jgi:hypothetical protein
MTRRDYQCALVVCSCLVVFCYLGADYCRAEITEQKAWSMFDLASRSKSVTQRTIGIRALGLL